MSMTRASRLDAAAARDEDLPRGEDRVAAVVPVDRVALPVGLPRAGAARGDRAHRLVRPRVERAAVGRHVQPRVERKVQRRGAQRPDRSRRRPHLGQVRAALRDQHLAVAQRRDARIPALDGHVGAERPRGAVVDVRLTDALQRRVLVAAGEEERAVGQVREAAAEDVVPREHGRRRVGAGHRVPQRRAGEGVLGVGLRRLVADGVVGEDLAVGHQGDVDADHRPVRQRPPAPRDVLVAGDGRRSGPRVGGRGRPRRRGHARLHGGVVDDRVLGEVIGPAAGERRAWRRRGEGENDESGSADAHGHHSSRTAPSPGRLLPRPTVRPGSGAVRPPKV